MSDAIRKTEETNSRPIVQGHVVNSPPKTEPVVYVDGSSGPSARSASNIIWLLMVCLCCFCCLAIIIPVAVFWPYQPDISYVVRTLNNVHTNIIPSIISIETTS